MHDEISGRGLYDEPGSDDCVPRDVEDWDESDPNWDSLEELVDSLASARPAELLWLP